MTRAVRSGAGRVRSGLLGFGGRFARDRRGAFAMMAAVAMPMLIALVFIGIDLARMMAARSQLQSASDAAALALARQPSATQQDQAKLKAQAAAWINANLGSDVGQVSAGALTVSSTASQVTIQSSIDVSTSIGSLMGVPSWRVSTSTVVDRSLKHVELALVLDNTGSMAQDDKIGTLKTAAGGLVDTLTTSAVASGDQQALKIAVVPFAQTVNVGSQYQGKSWLVSSSPYPNDPDQGGPRFDGFAQLSATFGGWAGCVEDRPMPYDILDTPPTPSKPNTYFVPYFAPDEPDDDIGQFVNSYIDDASSSSDWQTRQNNLSKYYSPKKELGKKSSSVYSNPGPNWGCQVTALMRLTAITSTSDASKVHDKLNAMQPSGDTEIPVGLIWGWHVLSPNAPFADGTAYGASGVLKIVVLVTDGQNTYSTGVNTSSKFGNGSYYTALGYLASKRISVGGPTADGGSPTQGDFSNPAAALDDRLTKLCANMKAAPNKIIIYTVPVEVTDTNIKTRLQNCATDAAHYIDATSTAKLTAAFQDIAGQISALRVSK